MLQLTRYSVISPEVINAYTADFPLLLVRICLEEESMKIFRLLSTEDLCLIALFDPILKEHPANKLHYRVPCNPQSLILAPYIEEEAIRRASL